MYIIKHLFVWWKKSLGNWSKTTWCEALHAMLEAETLINIHCSSSRARLEIGVLASFATLCSIPATWTPVCGRRIIRLTNRKAFLGGCRTLRISSLPTLGPPAFQRGLWHLWRFCFVCVFLLLLVAVCLYRFLCILFTRASLLALSFFCQRSPQRSLLLRSHMVGPLVLSSEATVMFFWVKMDIHLVYRENHGWLKENPQKKGSKSEFATTKGLYIYTYCFQW